MTDDTNKGQATEKPDAEDAADALIKDGEALIEIIMTLNPLAPHLRRRVIRAAMAFYGLGLGDA